MTLIFDVIFYFFIFTEFGVLGELELVEYNIRYNILYFVTFNQTKTKNKARKS